MITETDKRILNLMLETIKRMTFIVKTIPVERIQSEFIYSDSIQFEFEKLYEDSQRLSAEFRLTHKDLHINELRAIRNRIAHEYASVSIKRLIDTVQFDLPQLQKEIENSLK